MKYYVKIVMITYVMLLLFTNFTLYQVLSASSSQNKWVEITILNDGTVIVDIKGFVDRGINIVKLPVNPIDVTIRVLLNNTLIPTIYVNNTVLIPSTTRSSYEIRYLANVSTLSNGKLEFNVLTNDTIHLVLMPQVILLSMPENILEASMSDSNITLVFKGSTSLTYALLTSISITLTATTPQTRTTHSYITTTYKAPSPTPRYKHVTKKITAVRTETGTLAVQTITTTIITKKVRVVTGTSQQVKGGGVPPTLIVTGIAVTIIALLIVILLIKYGHGGKKGDLHRIELIDELDREILRKINELGGSVLQSELYRYFLNVPKATFWRHIRRLKNLGFIDILKEGRINKIILKKRIK